MVFKCYAYAKAKQSLALGRNPHLIFGYMQQLPLQEMSHHSELTGVEDARPLPLLVLKEEKRHVEEHPQGYVIKDISGLVTID